MNNKNINIQKSATFDIKQNNLNHKILLSDNEDIIATVLTGKTSSIFNKNPYISSDLTIKDNTFLTESIKDTQIALIADVDILDDNNWISPKSPDRNPFSIIETSGNGEFFKSLIDYIIGNEAYLVLPYNNQSFNKQSIGEIKQEQIWNKIKLKYKQIQEEITQQKMFLYKQSNENLDKMNTLLQITSIGKNIGKQEKSLQNMEYNSKEEYSKTIQKIILIQTLFIPLCIILLIFITFRIHYRSQQKKLKEKYND